MVFVIVACAVIYVLKFALVLVSISVLLVIYIFAFITQIWMLKYFRENQSYFTWY